LPVGFIDFFKEANGADITTDDHYVVLWPLTDMVGLNREYIVNKYAPEFFIIGSDGGDMSYAIKRIQDMFLSSYLLECQERKLSLNARHSQSSLVFYNVLPNTKAR